METLTPAMEDYLELILKLKRENKVVRVRDIARGLNVTMPGVTAMLSNLAKKNLITHGKYEHTELTSYGLRKARDAQRKHTTLFNFLTRVLKVDPRQADIDSCRIEHVISPLSLKRLVQFIEFIDSCPMARYDYRDYYNTNCLNGSSKEKCELHAMEYIASSYPNEGSTDKRSKATKPLAKAQRKRNLG
jgi:DtxR family transcriptional regulator, Mn-dependent transcriptional regulator